ncbi:hypothetical protein, conserved [Angomonas deanei]|uniref:C3H1-type domain-containing protein n=1 Tax=Angomonas deanei TaxID=59799 RepID=A0A7G2CF75_9TRYP|nr:hypothetical protein, conserved [Angomonas deanei]
MDFLTYHNQLRTNQQNSYKEYHFRTQRCTRYDKETKFCPLGDRCYFYHTRKGKEHKRTFDMNQNDKLRTSEDVERWLNTRQRSHSACPPMPPENFTIPMPMPADAMTGWGVSYLPQQPLYPQPDHGSPFLVANPYSQSFPSFTNQQEPPPSGVTAKGITSPFQLMLDTGWELHTPQTTGGHPLGIVQDNSFTSLPNTINAGQQQDGSAPGMPWSNIVQAGSGSYSTVLPQSGGGGSSLPQQSSSNYDEEEASEEAVTKFLGELELLGLTTDL